MIETNAEWIKRTRRTVTKGRRNLIAEFEEKHQVRVDKAVRMMKDQQASNYEVMRECGFAQHVVRRIRKQRVEMTDHPF